MNAPTSHEVQHPASPKEDRFLAVIVYEDEATFLRAEAISSKLIREFHDTEFDCLWVAFRGLTNTDVAEDAAAKAAEADLVIFSAHAGLQLPDAVKQWIESWLPHKNLEESALAALIGLPNDKQKGITPIHAYLEEIATRAHMDFFPQVIPAESQKGNCLESSPESYEVQLAKMLKQSFFPQHWGLND